MAYGIGRRIHAVRHDGAVAKHVVGLPIIGGVRAGLIPTCAGIANGDIAEESHGRDCIIGVVHPDAVVNASGGVFKRGCLVKNVGGTYTKVIVLIPIGDRT